MTVTPPIVEFLQVSVDTVPCVRDESVGWDVSSTGLEGHRQVWAYVCP